MGKVNTLESDFESAADAKASDDLLEKLANHSNGYESLSGHELANPKEIPSVSLNTRIPRTLSEKIDDFIYFNKKLGISETKQSLTIKAIQAYLKRNLSS